MAEGRIVLQGKIGNVPRMSVEGCILLVSSTSKLRRSPEICAVSCTPAWRSSTGGAAECEAADEWNEREQWEERWEPHIIEDRTSILSMMHILCHRCKDRPSATSPRAEQHQYYWQQTPNRPSKLTELRLRGYGRPSGRPD
jgi:hypothetical protein